MKCKERYLYDPYFGSNKIRISKAKNVFFKGCVCKRCGIRTIHAFVCVGVEGMYCRDCVGIKTERNIQSLNKDSFVRIEIGPQVRFLGETPEHEGPFQNELEHQEWKKLRWSDSLVRISVRVLTTEDGKKHLVKLAEVLSSGLQHDSGLRWFIKCLS